jgi:trigger factor
VPRGIVDGCPHTSHLLRLSDRSALLSYVDQGDRTVVKSAVETLNPTRVRLTVEVPFDELRPSLDAAYKKIARQVNVPGFRRGKVPPRIIDQRFGRAVVLEEAVNDALPGLYTQAVVDNNVRVLGQPDVDVTEFADGTELKFTAEVEIRPEIELPDYEGIEVTVDDADVTDERVDEELTSLRERFATLLTVERPAAMGDFVTIDLSTSKDGEPIEEAQATGMSYEIGSGSMLDGLDDALIGLSAGESATFKTTLVAGEHADEEVDTEVTVGTVKERQLPELDDEFALLASEYDTLDELRRGLRERLERVGRITQVGQARDRVLEALLNKVDMPMPERAIENRVEAQKHDLEHHRLEPAGLTLETFLEHDGRTEDELLADFRKDAEQSIKAEFVLDAIADRAQVSVSEGELGEHIVRSAMRYGVTPDDFAKQVIDAGQQGLLVGEVRRGKALATVVEAATVVDTSARAVDIKALNAAESASSEAVDQDTDENATSNDGAEAETATSGTDQPEEAIRS